MPDQLNFALLILRVVTGLMIIAHGYNHVFRGGKIQGTGRWFGSMGMKPGILHAWLASITELTCGVLLLLGLLTPFAAGGVLGVMVVAWITAHRKNGFFIFRPGEGWEYVANLAIASLAIGALGPGEWSLDNSIDFVLHGWKGFAAAVIIGAGGCAALLVTFWRPPAREPKSS
jgi:putative oxidoreductase